jgi:dolichyl-phosphate beta-glucosyltransferase
MASTSRPFLSIVIPAFNEEARLPTTLAGMATFLDGRGLDAEIVVVDDGSTDGTAAVAEAALRGRRGRVLRNRENRGKGHAVRRGILEASGRFALLSDADLSTPIEEYDKLAAAVRDNDLDAAIGSRALPGSDVQVRQHWIRQTMGRTFNRIIRVLTGLRFHDTQCGFKLMDRERVRPIVEKMVVDGFAFDVELLYVCQRFGLAVREIPVVWRNAAGSKVSIVGDPIRMIGDVLRVRWRFRRGLYNPGTEATGG